MFRAGHFSVLVAVLLSVPVPFSIPALAENVLDPKVQGIFSQKVKVALPPGWNIINKQSGVIPSDWYSENDQAGYLVEASRGEDTLLQVCFLPANWIGIRKVPNNALQTYWSGILGNQGYKTITSLKDKSMRDQYHFIDKFDHMLDPNLSTPSLINGGYYSSREIFKGKFDKANETAKLLVRKHCTSEAELNEAANSLILLGVPAKSVYLQAALQGRTETNSSCISALGYMGGQDCIGVLCDILKNPQQPDLTRKYAAQALDVVSQKEFDRRMGPALAVALEQVKNEDSLSGIVRAITHLRYKPAGAALLAAFKRMKNDYYKLELAQTLASLRYQDALAELQSYQAQFAQEQTASVKMASISQMPGADPVAALQLAILRLNGDWGTSNGKMRLMVIPPKDASIGKKIELRLYVENLGDGIFQSWNSPDCGLVIDGKPINNPFSSKGLSYNVRPGDVHCLWYDASPYIKDPGMHKVQYSVDGAVSKLSTFVVR